MSKPESATLKPGDQAPLFVGERKRIGIGKLAREFTGQRFGGLPARREDEDRPEVLRERLGHKTRPVAANLVR